MRLVLCALTLLPLPALADTFTLNSQATEATLYAPYGAQITHEVDLSLPAGTHLLRLPDLPADFDPQGLRISAPGLRIGAITYRADDTPPRLDPERPEVLAVRAKIEEIEARMQDVRDTAARTALAIEAAQAQIDFLTGLGGNEALPGDVATLRDLSQMVRSESLAARQTALTAKIEARSQRDALKDLQRDLEAARAALAALIPEPTSRPLLSVEVTAATQVDNIPLRVTFLHSEAGWEPVYTMRLNDDETPTLTVERSALVAQVTGENWRGVALTLSTQRPSGQINPSDLRPDRRVLYDPSEIQPRANMRNLSMDGVAGAQMELETVLAEEPAMERATQGLALTYAFNRPIDLASDADEALLQFDEVQFEAELRARAVPFHDTTAYLVASFTNTSGEPLLPIGASRFFDGGYVGNAPIPMIPDGEEAEIGFGPIDGLVINRTIINRNTGDRGLISRSNETREEVRIDLRNLTARGWDVELIDRVPYSEQEDLEITYTASPEPDIRGLDDKRGILQWNIALSPGSAQTVATRYLMEWPEGQTVR